MRQFPPRRLICLTEETVETLYLLGEQDRIVGVSGYAVRPPEVRSKPRVSAFTSARLDRILALEPDLVLAFSDLQADIVRELAQAGVAVHLFNQRDLAGIFAMIRTVGALVGAGDRAEALARSLETRVAEMARATWGSARPRVYFEEWNEPMISAIGWVSELIEIAGGEDVFAHLRPGDRGAPRRDPGLVVRPQGRHSPDRRTTRMGRSAGCRQRSHRRDQVADHPSARSGGADRRPRCAARRHITSRVIERRPAQAHLRSIKTQGGFE
jgi:hypothetical protein